MPLVEFEGGRGGGRSLGNLQKGDETKRERENLDHKDSSEATSTMIQQRRFAGSKLTFTANRSDSIASRFKVSGLKRDNKTRDGVVSPKSAKIDLSRFIVNGTTCKRMR